MTTLKPPFRAEDMEGLYKKVIRGNCWFLRNLLMKTSLRPLSKHSFALLTRSEQSYPFIASSIPSAQTFLW